MSIAAEISRIKSAKEAIILAVRAKGVEIPDDVKIEDIPAYIGLIVQGAQVDVADDGNGNVTITGLSATDDGNGNVTVTGTSASEDNGNLTIGG